MNRLLFTLCLAGCANDPCAGKPPVCISVRATGSLAEIDGIALEVSRLGMAPLSATAARGTGRFHLPVLFAVRLPSDFLGEVSLSGSALSGNAVVGRGAASLRVGAAGHGSTTLALAPSAAEDLGFAADGMVADGAAPSDLPGGGADLFPPDLFAPDLTPTIPFLTSGAFPSTLVTKVADMVISFVNPTANPITVSSATLATGGVFSIMTNGCSGGVTLSSGGRCDMNVRFFPMVRGSYSDTLTVSHSAGTLQGALSGVGVSWNDESIPSGAVSLTGISGTTVDDVWACGENNLLYHRATSWAQVSGYSSGTPSFKGLYVTTESVYLIDGTNTVYRFNRASPGWSAQNYSSVGFFTGITGVGETLWIASDTGVVLVGNFGGFIRQDRMADSTALAALAVAGTSAYAVGGTAYVRRTAFGWQPVLNDNGMTYNGVFATDTDIFGVGTRTTVNGPQMTVVHALANNSLRSYTDIIGGAARGVSGFSSNDVFIVGENGLVARSTNTAGNGVWKVEPIGKTVPLYAVWGAAGEIWAVGGNLTIAHRY